MLEIFLIERVGGTVASVVEESSHVPKFKSSRNPRVGEVLC